MSTISQNQRMKGKLERNLASSLDVLKIRFSEEMIAIPFRVWRVLPEREVPPVYKSPRSLPDLPAANSIRPEKPPEWLYDLFKESILRICRQTPLINQRQVDAAINILTLYIKTVRKYHECH